MGIRSAGARRRRPSRTVGSACLAGCAVLVLAACAAPPDLTTLAGSPSTTPSPATVTATPPWARTPISSGGHQDETGDPAPAPEWSTSAVADATERSGWADVSTSRSGPGWVRPAGDHPQRVITLGEDVDLTDEPGYPDIAVTVERVTRDAGCPQGPPPRLGQYLALDLIVRRTRPDHDVVGLTTLEWVAVGTDGATTTTHGLSGFLCHKATEQFPLRFGERDEVRGQLIIDAPPDTVTLTATVPWDHRAARLLIPAGTARG